MRLVAAEGVINLISSWKVSPIKQGGSTCWSQQSSVLRPSCLWRGALPHGWWFSEALMFKCLFQLMTCRDLLCSGGEHIGHSWFWVEWYCFVLRRWGLNAQKSDCMYELRISLEGSWSAKWDGWRCRARHLSVASQGWHLSRDTGFGSFCFWVLY